MVASRVALFVERGSSSPSRSWRAHRKLLIGLASVVVVAVFVVSDLPTSATARYRRAALRSYVASVFGNVVACRDGLRDALAAARASLGGSAGIAPGLAQTFTAQGIAACSFTSSAIVSLASMAPPHGLSAVSVSRVAPAVTAWAFPASFTYLQDLKAVLAAPGSAGARRTLARAAVTLTARRAAAEGAVARVERAYGVAVRPLALTRAVALPAVRVGGAHERR